MSSLNKVFLVGNVGVDPDIKTSQQGASYGRLSLATSEYWKDKLTGEPKSSTVWHTIKLFDAALIDLCQKYIHKGSKICIEGSIRNYEFDKNGEKHTGTEILAKKILLLDKKETTVEIQPSVPKYSKQAKEEFFSDEVPF